MTTTPTPIATPESVPAPLPDARTLAEQATACLDRLERAARNARAQVAEIPPGLDAVIGHVQEFMRGQDPVWARQLAAREVRLAEQTLDSLAQALTDARVRLTEQAPMLHSLAEAAAGRRGRLEVLGEDDLFETRVHFARLAHGRLERLVEQVEPWGPTAVDTVARLGQATVIALRRHRVEALARELAALKARVNALHEPDAHDRDACAVLARLVERVGHPLPVATIRWPKSADPFAPPDLIEAEG